MTFYQKVSENKAKIGTKIGRKLLYDHLAEVKSAINYNVFLWKKSHYTINSMIKIIEIYVSLIDLKSLTEISLLSG